MKIILFGFLLFFYSVCPGFVRADTVAGSSAAMKKNDQVILDRKTLDTEKIFKIKKAMQYILGKYNSPMKSEIDSFVAACLEYELNCYLLPSIAGLESTFGRFLLPGSFNPFGWGGGNIYFKDWNDGINTVALGLRKNYINRGADELYKIGSIYSESPTWTPRVQYFINQFEEREEKIELYLTMNQVKL